MANMGNAGGKFVAEFGNLLKSFGVSFKDEAARKAVAESIKKVDFKDIGKTPGRGIIGNIVGWTTWAPRKLGQATINVGTRAVNGLARFYPEHRILTGVGLVGGVAGAGYLMAEGKHNKAEAAAREGAMEQIAMMQAASPYMNSVSPQEAAMLDERMRNTSNGGSMADMEAQRRAAAQAANTPVAG